MKVNGMIYQANALLQELKNRREFEGIHSSSIYYLVLDKLNPKLKGSKNYDSEFGRIEITREEVMDKMGIDYDHIGQWLSRAEEQLKHLLHSETEVITPEGKSYYNWLSHYTKNEKGFVIQLNPFLIPYLLVLDDKAYTRIPQDLLLKMNSEYARNLVETICLFPQIGKDGKLTKTGFVKRYIDKSVIGEFLGSPEYNRWTDFKKYVIEKAVDDVNAHKDETGFEILSVNYEKSGRRVVGVEFVAKVPESVWRENDRKIVSQKSSEIQKNKRVAFYHESHHITSMSEHTEETIAGMDLFALGVDMPMCDNLVKKHGVIVVNRNIKMLRERGKIKPALLVKAIQEDYAGQSKFRDLLDFL